MNFPQGFGDKEMGIAYNERFENARPSKLTNLPAPLKFW